MSKKGLRFAVICSTMVILLNIFTGCATSEVKKTGIFPIPYDGQPDAECWVKKETCMNENGKFRGIRVSSAQLGDRALAEEQARKTARVEAALAIKAAVSVFQEDLTKILGARRMAKILPGAMADDRETAQATQVVLKDAYSNVYPQLWQTVENGVEKGMFWTSLGFIRIPADVDTQIAKAVLDEKEKESEDKEYKELVGAAKAGLASIKENRGKITAKEPAQAQ